MLTRLPGIASLLLTIIMLAGLMPVSSASLAGPTPAVAAAHQDQNDSNQNHHNGKGNDDKEKKDKDEKKDKGKGNENAAPVDATRSYSVNVNCVYQSVDELTTCSFEGLALEDAKKVGQLVAPEDQLCAAVTGNDG